MFRSREHHGLVEKVMIYFRSDIVTFLEFVFARFLHNYVSPEANIQSNPDIPQIPHNRPFVQLHL